MSIKTPQSTGAVNFFIVWLTFFFQLMESLKSCVTSKIGISLMGCVNYLHCIVSTLEFRRLYRYCSGLSTIGMRIVQLLLPMRLLIYTCDPCVVKVIARRLKQKKKTKPEHSLCASVTVSVWVLHLNNFHFILSPLKRKQSCCKNTVFSLASRALIILQV